MHLDRSQLRDAQNKQLLKCAIILQYTSPKPLIIDPSNMAASKPTTLTLRIDPAIKEGLRLLAEKEHRSLTNMIEVVIRDCCKLHNR
jgi:hypothetical protein